MPCFESSFGKGHVETDQGQVWAELGLQEDPCALGGRLCLLSVPLLCSCLLSCLDLDSGSEARTEFPRLLKDHTAASQTGEALRQQSKEILTARHSHSQQNGPKAVESRYGISPLTSLLASKRVPLTLGLSLQGVKWVKCV